MTRQRAHQPVSLAPDSPEDELKRLRARVAEMESELEIRTLHLELVTDGVWDWDLRTDYEYMSPRFWTTLGYDPKDFPHHPSAWQGIIHPEDGEAALKLFEDHTKTGKEYRLPVRYRHKDGHWVWVVCRGQALKNEQGEYYRMLGAHQEVTEFKKNEEALAQAHRQFSESFLHAPIGVALVSTEGRWLRVNRALCDIVGYAEEELLELTFQDITHPDDLETDLHYLQQMLCGERETYQMDKRYFHKDGHVIWAQLNVALLRDSDGQPVHFISQIQDITPAREHLDRVEALNEELRQLLDTFSHDLSEPVRKLSVYSARVREAIRTKDADLALRSLDVLQSESGRLGEIHDGLLQYLRVATQKLRWEEVDLEALIVHQANRLRNRIDALFAKLEIDPLPVVVADRVLLSSTLHHLLDNALKYHRPGVRPLIHVFAEDGKDGSAVSICIRDNGVGMNNAHKESALRMFHRLEGRHAGGEQGIGLALCRKIIERHGGTLDIRPHVGEPGLTVMLSLPVPSSHRNPQPPS